MVIFRQKFFLSSAVFLFAIALSAESCTVHKAKKTDGFSAEVSNIIDGKCVTCHASGKAEGGFGFVNDVKKLIENEYIVIGKPAESLLYQKVLPDTKVPSRMPFGGPYLSSKEIASLEKWIADMPVDAVVTETPEPTESPVPTATPNPVATAAPTPTIFSVTASGDLMTITASGSTTVQPGTTLAFTVTADSGRTLSTTVVGTCAAGSWSGAVYTTGAITADCTVLFSVVGMYSVTASGDNLTVTANESTSVQSGGTLGFTVTPGSGRTLSTTFTGTCAAGTWSGSVYTTGAITANCTVVFSVLPQFVVTQSVTSTLITLNTTTPQNVTSGLTTSFTLTSIAVRASSTNTGTTAAPSYAAASAVGGTCPTGSWSGTTYTTGAITATCTVIFAVANPCPTTLSSVSFATEIATMMQNSPVNTSNRSCMDSGCHASTATKAVFGTTGAVVYSTLLAANTISISNSPGSPIIVSGDPYNSWLYRKTTTAWVGGPTTVRMPRNPTSTFYLSSDEQSKICNWIFNGAANN